MDIDECNLKCHLNQLDLMSRPSHIIILIQRIYDHQFRLQINHRSLRVTVTQQTTSIFRPISCHWINYTNAFHHIVHVIAIEIEKANQQISSRFLCIFYMIYKILACCFWIKATIIKINP
jgi:hypothetical protein